MSLIKNIFNRPSKKEQEKTNKGQVDLNDLIACFEQLKGRPDFPFTLAKQNLEDIKENTQSKDQMLLFVLEDSIFASLYATFYEQILITLQANLKLTHDLIESFEADSKTREQTIAEQTELHLNYILNNGKCQGCASCNNHHDVDELLHYYQKGDLDFFINLFLGMQTIQFSMDHLLYHFIPTYPDLAQALSNDNILKLRQFIFNYTQKHSA